MHVLALIHLIKTYKFMTNFTKTWVSGKSLLIIKQENDDNTIELISKLAKQDNNLQSNNVVSHVQIVPYEPRQRRRKC